MSNFFNSESHELLALLLSSLRVSTPLIFAAMAGFFSERSGIVNIALEGKILIGSLTGVLAASYFHSPWMGLMGAAVVGLVIGAAYALMTIILKADHIVSGVALNLFAAGITPLACNYFYGASGSSASLASEDRFLSAPVYLALVIPFLIDFWSRFTPSGLWHRVAGEEPKALKGAGISVLKLQFTSLMISGALASMGGAVLSTFLSSSFSRNMSAGRGFIALAALILGRWKPLPTFFACLFFGLSEALQIRLQGLSFSDGSTLPVQWIFILPYAITLIVLAGFLGRSRAPKALGRIQSE